MHCFHTSLIIFENVILKYLLGKSYLCFIILFLVICFFGLFLRRRHISLVFHFPWLFVLVSVQLEKKKKNLCLHELDLNRRPSSAALHNILGASQNFLLVQPDFLFLVVPQYVTPAKSHQHIQLNISEASTLCKFYYLEALSNVFTPRERVKVWVSSSILSVLNWGTNSLLHTNVIFLLTDLQASSKYMPGLFSILKTQDRRQYFKKSF